MTSPYVTLDRVGYGGNLCFHYSALVAVVDGDVDRSFVILRAGNQTLEYATKGCATSVLRLIEAAALADRTEWN